jgi:hypothetical protein
MPGFILLLYMLWREAENRFSLIQLRAAITAFLCLGLVSIAIHLNGLYGPATSRWNLVVIPGPTQLSAPLGDFFDWRYAQFMASNEMVCEIAAEKVDAYLRYDESLAPYKIDEPITWAADRSAPVPIRYTLELAAQGGPGTEPGAQDTEVIFMISQFSYLPVVAKSGNLALFIGWEEPVAGSSRRLSICPKAEIIFYLEDKPMLEERYWLRVTADSVGSQDVVIFLNDTLLGEVNWPAAPQDVTVAISAQLLKPGMLNRIRFEFSEATSAPPEFDDLRLQYDDRQLALGFNRMAIVSSSEEQVTATPSPSPYP